MILASFYRGHILSSDFKFNSACSKIAQKNLRVGTKIGSVRLAETHLQMYFIFLPKVFAPGLP